MKFGIELETVGLTCQEITSLLNAAGVPCRFQGYTHEVMQSWKVVPDGTPSSMRIAEVVSPPMEISEESFAIVRKVCEVLNENGADVKKSCGFHCHIDMTGESNQTIANVYNRYRKFETEIDRWMPASRRGRNSSYAQTLQNQGELTLSATATKREVSASRPCRGSKVNLCSFVKYGTIEFRQHSGTINAGKIKNWVLFLADFVAASRATVSTTTATIAEQIRSLSPKKRNLINHLINNGPSDYASIIAAIDSTQKSAESMICRMKKDGLPIKKQNGKFFIDTTATTAASQQAQSDDSVFNGVRASVKRFYQRRAQFLAS